MDTKRNVTIISKDFSGLGFAYDSSLAGDNVLLAYKNDDIKEEEPEKQEAFEMVGDGLVNKMPLDEFMKERAKHRNDYIIFDQNYLSEYSEKLRSEGFQKVFGASKFTDKMEHDRNFGVEIMKKAGFDIPETYEFPSVDEGLSFLEEKLNDEEPTAWVFKPDGDQESYMTFVPSNWDDKKACEELIAYMRYLSKDPGTYILQKRIKGVEINVEAWFYKGEPFFAFCCLENKRKLNRDAGCNVGCAQDIAFIVPLDGELVKETIGKSFLYYKSISYTGFGDVNLIISDRKFYFLEVCNRYGYNSHPNLFKTLAVDSFGDIMCDFIDGKTKNFYEHFRKGFGASVLLYNEHPRKIPVVIEDSLKKDFFHFDTMVEEDQLLTAGYSAEVGILAKHGWTIEEAATECLDAIDLYEEINFPDISYRSDLNQDYGANAPIRRYKALVNMGLI